MTVTYEQAREIVRDRFESGWTHGTFCLDDRKIVENDEFYVFDVGAREFIVDGDWSYMIAGGTPIVYKSDGRVGSRRSVDVAMDPSIRRHPNPNPTFTVLRVKARHSLVRGPRSSIRLGSGTSPSSRAASRGRPLQRWCHQAPECAWRAARS